MKASRLLLGATTAGFAVVVALHVASPSAAKVLAAPPTTTAPRSSGTTTTLPPAGVRSAVGTSAQYGYGTISVKVTANGSHVVGVSVASLQTLESYSQQLANQVIPTLTSEALAAQSANIQGVSGASYTSSGFAQSLQSAFSQLGI